MTDGLANEEQRLELEAATQLWEEIAAFAWDQYVTFGPGVVLMERAHLFAAHEAKRDGRESRPALGYVPLTDIPPGDDFRALIRSIDSRTQVALLIGRTDEPDREDAEQFYVLEMLEGKRPSPEDCYFAQEQSRRT